MTHRILPTGEYERLPDDFRAVVLAAPVGDVQVIVVERYDGEIVAHWAMVRIPHVEGVWIAPDYRKQPAVVRHLMVGMQSAARVWGVSRVTTAAVDDDVRRLLRHFGAEEILVDGIVPTHHTFAVATSVGTGRLVLSAGDGDSSPALAASPNDNLEVCNARRY